MAGLDDLFAEIPVQDIASKLGADEGEVNNAIRRWCPHLSAGCSRTSRLTTSTRASSSPPSPSKVPAACSTAGSASTRSTKSEGDQFVAQHLRRQRQQCRRLGAGRHRRRRRRSDQEAAADPGADRAGLHRQAVRAEGCGPGRRRRPGPGRAVAAGSATCWAASSAAPVALAAGTTRSAASWAACSAAQPGQCDRRDPRRPARRQEVVAPLREAPARRRGVSGAFASAGRVFIECRGDRQFESRRQLGADALPKSWDPGAVEGELYQGWVDAGYFKADASSGKPAYSIVLPPPNVTGSLHMGHALDHTLMDALTRRKRMQGYEVLWLPGMDHAGIATQTVVEKQLAVDGKTKEDFGRELFIDKVWDWKRESGGTIGGQMRRLGDGVDWSRDRFTMDDGLSRGRADHLQAAVRRRADLPRRAAGQLVAGAADRDLRPRGEVRGRRGRAGVASATARSTTTNRTSWWPPPGSRRCSATPRSRCTPTTSATATWSARRCQHPFIGRQILDRRRRPRRPRIRYRRSEDHPGARPQRLRDRAAAQPADADDHGQARPGSPTPEPNSTAWTASRRASRSARRWPSRAASSPRSAPTCTASGTPSAAASRSSRGCRCSGGSRSRPLAKAAGDAVRNGDTVIHPPSLEPRWFAWVDNMHDWCISRQLWWGHRIPIWHGPDGETRLRRPRRDPARGLGAGPRRARHLVLLGAVAVLDAWAGPSTPPSWRSSIPPAFWSPATTSCSSGWPG